MNSGKTYQDGQDGKEGRGFDRHGAFEVLDCALEVVGPVGRFGGEGPGGFVAGADVDAAEEDGVESWEGGRFVRVGNG